MKRFSGLIPLIGLVLSGVAVVAISTVFFLVSSSVANTKLAIFLREIYYYRFVKMAGQLSENILPSLFAVQTVKSSRYPGYLYLIKGNYQEIDTDNDVVYLKTREGILYGFHYMRGPDDSLHYSEKGSVSSPAIDKVIDFSLVNSGSSNLPFHQGDKIVILWEDRRTLKEILAGTQHDSKRILNQQMSIYDLQMITLIQ